MDFARKELVQQISHPTTNAVNVTKGLRKIGTAGSRRQMRLRRAVTSHGPSESEAAVTYQQRLI
jgi:hypothetical protein